jgi:hypothetical protein
LPISGRAASSLVRQFVGSFVFGVAGVAFDPAPVHLVTLAGGI